MERMSDEEAREMVSPELRDLADRRGWAIKGCRLRIREVNRHLFGTDE